MTDNKVHYNRSHYYWSMCRFNLVCISNTYWCLLGCTLISIFLSKSLWIYLNWYI